MTDEVQSFANMTGLSLTAGRQALASGTGTPSQRRMLQAFYSEYDKAQQAGLTRQDALDRGLEAMRSLGAKV